MNVWRGLLAAFLVAVVAPALLVPFGELTQPAAWSWSRDDAARLLHLSINTLSLAAGTLAVSLPLGVCLAVLLFRVSFWPRRLLLFLLIVLLFVPLPIVVSSWQALLGADGWLPTAWWRSGEGRLWATGLGAAVWIHALASVPWVACIVGLGLTWVEPEREEEATLAAVPWRVLFLVTLPRVRASLLAGALFVGLQTAGEIGVTDMMLVSTLAEETHTQFTLGERAALARTLIVALPGLLLAWVGVLGVLSYLEKSLPPLSLATQLQRSLHLGPGWMRWMMAALLIGLLVAPPFSLVWKLGLSGHPLRWSALVAWHHLRAEAILLGGELLATLGGAVITGVLTAWLALVVCWLARDCRWFCWLVFSLLTWAWVLPGPVVGIGLQETIRALPNGPWMALLYDGPSPVPLVWVQLIRALPIAVVFLWPTVRLMPRELFETARLHGAGPLSEFVHIVVPMTWGSTRITALAAVAWCLGEVGASARVETPGWETFTKLLFDRMHYGVDNNVAALGVLLLGSITTLGLVFVLIEKRTKNVTDHR